MRDVTVRSRSIGSSHQIGSGAIIADTLFPSAPCSSSARTLIGTMARSSRSRVEAPVDRRYRPSAPVTAERMTSFTVPPAMALIRFSSARSVRTQSKRRYGPISRLSGDCGRRQSGTDERAGGLEVLDGRAGHAARGAQRPGGAAKHRRRASHALQDRIGQKLCPAGLGPGEPRLRVAGSLGLCGPGRRGRWLCQPRTRRRPERDASLRRSRSGRPRVRRRATSPRPASSDRGAGRRFVPRACGAAPRSPGEGGPCGARGSRGSGADRRPRRGEPWPNGTNRSFWRKRGTRCNREAMWSRNSS